MQAQTGPSRMLASETVREGTQAGQKREHTQHNTDKHNKHEQHTNKQKAKTNKKQLLDFSSRPSQSDSDVKLSESSTTAGCASSGGAPKSSPKSSPKSALLESQLNHLCPLSLSLSLSLSRSLSRYPKFLPAPLCKRCKRWERPRPLELLSRRRRGPGRCTIFICVCDCDL